MLLMLAGDIESNPGPKSGGKLSFAVWNLNSLLARDGSKISLIEGLQDSMGFHLFGVCESWLNDDATNDKINIGGFAPDPFRADCPKANDHPRGGVCLYYKEDLPIIQRKYICHLSECVIAEIKLYNKKIFFILLYRSPSQSNNELDIFNKNLETTLSEINKENPS